jgi:hypothetical protein
MISAGYTPTSETGSRLRSSTYLRKRSTGIARRWVLYFFRYNFCRRYKSLRVSSAMAAGVTDELLSMEHLCKLMDEANPPKKRGPYKKAA